MKTLKMAAGDLVINTDTGQLELVEDNDKLVQDVAEVLMDQLFRDDDVEFGSELSRLEDYSLPSSAHIPFIGHLVSKAMDRLVALQSQADVSDDERIRTYDIQVKRISNLSYVFYLDVQTVSGRKLGLPQYQIDLSHTKTIADLFRGL
jgi:hypothetical protein